MEKEFAISGIERRELRKERSTLRILVRDFWSDYEKDVELFKPLELDKSSYEKNFKILKSLLDEIETKLWQNI